MISILNLIILSGLIAILYGYIVGKQILSASPGNKKMVEISDKIYGQPFDEKASKNCDNYIYNLIPGSKEKMDELGSNQY